MTILEMRDKALQIHLSLKAKMYDPGLEKEIEKRWQKETDPNGIPKQGKNMDGLIRSGLFYKEVYLEMAMGRVKNTCWVWREDGPLIAEYKSMIKATGS